MAAAAGMAAGTAEPRRTQRANEGRLKAAVTPPSPPCDNTALPIPVMQCFLSCSSIVWLIELPRRPLKMMYAEWNDKTRQELHNDIHIHGGHDFARYS